MAEQGSAKRVQDLDPNMRLDQQFNVPIRWMSPEEAPIQLVGFPWFQQEGLYRRLPQSPTHLIPAAVDQLADCTSGGQIRFQTTSAKLFIKVELAGASDMYHMPATGQSGFDCYIGGPGEQKYISTTRFDHKQTSYSVQLFDLSQLDTQMRMITLNFPLYQGVQKIEIGIDPDADLAAPVSFSDDRRVIVYGTSITQGGCAARPGMSYTNILSRYINHEFINLGFSGNGRGEPELAHIISQIERPALLVLDYEANVGEPANLQQTLPEFIRIYRETHSDIPILVLSRILYAKDRFDAALTKLCDDRREIARHTVQVYQNAGDSNIEFYDGTDLLGDDYEECTVDGVHPTDLGFIRMANGLHPLLRRLLKQDQ